MPDKNEQLLKLLKDNHVLQLAYAASSDYVLRKSFGLIKELQVFRGKKELAPAILKQYEGFVKKLSNSVIIGAHLYALELTGEQETIRKAVITTLEQKELRQDPMVGQTAGKIASGLLRRKFSRDKGLSEPELIEILNMLRKEVNL